MPLHHQLINYRCQCALMVVPLLASLAQAQTFTVLYNFTGGSDGGLVYAGVIRDAAGNLYGTASEGGDLACRAGYGCGVVYEVNTAGTETVLYSFSPAPDGATPLTPVVRDDAGNLYGTTQYGGDGGGTVFEINSAG